MSSRLRRIALGYNRVVLDLGAGVKQTVRQLAAQAAICLVVTTDERTALTDADAFIKLTAARRPDADLRLVINLAASKGAGERTYATLFKACKIFLKVSPPLVGIVRHDAAVKDSIRHQSAMLTRLPNSRAAKDVQALAQNLLVS